MVFPVVIYGCESWTAEGRAAKNWCIQTVVLEKTPESPMDSKEIKPVNLQGNQPWILTGRTNAEAEAPVFWPPDANSRLIGKVPDAGKDWGQKEKRVSEVEMAGWYHQCNGHELGQALGDGEGQQGLACCSPWSCKELDMTEWLNSNNLDSSHLCRKLCSPNAQFYSTHLFLIPKWTSLHKALLSC